MRLPGAVSRLAAPFFGSQAEPSSRRRGISGHMVVSVWRLVKTSLMLRVVSAYAWYHFELFLLGSVYPSLRIIQDAGLHLFFDNVSNIAELLRSCSREYKCCVVWYKVCELHLLGERKITSGKIQEKKW